MTATLSLVDLVVAVPPGGRAGVPLRMRSGERVALLGPVEVGTATARTLVGLSRPASGRILVGDRDVTGDPPVRRQIGYVPCGGALLPHLTVAQNVEYGLRRRERVHGLAQSWVTSLTERLELVPTLHLRPHQLSAGQRLRAAVARAVACLPEVLIVDLPDGGDGAESLREMLDRATSPAALDPAVLVCTGSAALAAQLDRAVTPVSPARQQQATTAGPQS
ncbi:ATP-binding cassette domain-containing protein [Rhizomonospora bruguierae]|uniref:ATP-binding cassette domain-containing protein n=1 Tax=Rhizomonospora bruguierae TaxID=1581705 RepID=UPI001BCCFBD9|nr:ATP-binding cassette domain-containing protein [Micromonospora sp. NBRC 107566]